MLGTQQNTIYQYPQTLKHLASGSQNAQFVPKTSSASGIASSTIQPQQPNNPSVSTNSTNQVSYSTAIGEKERAVQLKKQGNVYKARGQYQEAIDIYKKALEAYPEYTDVLYNLGKTYRDTENHQDAIKTFEKLIKIDPKDYEAQTLLGEFYEDTNDLNSAISNYKQVLKNEPKYDYAKRRLQGTYVKQADPATAARIKKQAETENLAKALELINKYAPPKVHENLNGIEIRFGTTEEVNHYENMAQYENRYSRILISDALRFAAPEVTATYIVHESVHAGDRDSYSSIREEQDAFVEMVKFWKKVNNGIIDPDLTLALNLFNQSQGALETKVEEVYLKRDPNMPKVSPNHGQDTLVQSAWKSIRGIFPSAQHLGGDVRNTQAITTYPQAYAYPAYQYAYVQPVAQPVYAYPTYNYYQPTNNYVRYIPGDVGLTDVR